MTLLEYIDREQKRTGKPTVRRLVCRDGYKISVQCSKYHYCDLYRDESLSVLESKTVEIKVEDGAELPDWIPVDDYWIGAWIPVDLVEKLVAEHGGWDG